MPQFRMPKIYTSTVDHDYYDDIMPGLNSAGYLAQGLASDRAEHYVWYRTTRARAVGPRRGVNDMIDLLRRQLLEG